MSQIVEGLVKHRFSKYFLLALGVILVTLSFILPVVQLRESLAKEMFLHHSALSTLNQFSRDLPVAIIVSFLFYPYIFILAYLFFSIPFVNKAFEGILLSLDGIKKQNLLLRILIGFIQFLISFALHFLPIAVNFFYFYMFFYMSPHYGHFYTIFGLVITIFYFLTYYYYFRYKNVQDKYTSKLLYFSIIYALSSFQLFLLLTVKLSYDVRTIVSVGAFTGTIGTLFFLIGTILSVYQSKLKNPDDFNGLEMESKKKKPGIITKKKDEKTLSNEVS